MHDIYNIPRWIFVIVVVLVVVVFVVIGTCMWNRTYVLKQDIPVLYKKMNFEAFKEYNFDYFKKHHGDVNIYVLKTNLNSVDMNGGIKKMKLREYCDVIDDKDLYFKTEDGYDFMKIIGLKENISMVFDMFLKDKGKYKEKNKDIVVYKDCSFWMGGKGTTTGWHTDRDDLSYLYVLQGKKRIQLVSPEFNGRMYEKKLFSFGARWSEMDFQHVDYDTYPLFKDVPVRTYILEAGDCMYIPKDWWHCVENLEPTIGLTYKIFRLQHVKTLLSECIRKVYSMWIGYEMFDISKLLKSNLSNEEIEEMKNQILNR